MAKKHNWDAVDWSLPTQVIAGIIGCRESTVSRKRSEVAPDSRRNRVLVDRRCGKKVKFPHVDWEKQDWENKNNREILEENGIDPEVTNLAIANNWRKKYAPDTKSSGRKVVDWESIDWNLSNDEIARQTQKHKVYVCNMRSIHGWRHVPEGTRFRLQRGRYFQCDGIRLEDDGMVRFFRDGENFLSVDQSEIEEVRF